MKHSFQAEFGNNVSVNHPFRGGYITRTHASELPWIQLEISRAPFMNNQEKRERTLRSLASGLRGF